MFDYDKKFNFHNGTDQYPARLIGTRQNGLNIVEYFRGNEWIVSTYNFDNLGKTSTGVVFLKNKIEEHLWDYDYLKDKDWGKWYIKRNGFDGIYRISFISLKEIFLGGAILNYQGLTQYKFKTSATGSWKTCVKE